MTNTQPLTVWMTDDKRCLLWDRASWVRYVESLNKQDRSFAAIDANVKQAIERAPNNRAVRVTMSRGAADALLARQPRR